MSTEVAISPTHPKSITADMAARYGMEAPAFEATLRATVFPHDGKREEFAAFLLVAKQYSLNPVTKEIYAYPKRGGGIIPIVSIDGWMNLLNSHPAFDGMHFAEAHDENGNLISTTCTIHRKDRSHPIAVTEYLAECIRATDPWKMKHRMLRHKSAIQCGRYAFGFAGIYEEDEAERFAAPEREAHVRHEPPAPPPAAIELPPPALSCDEPPAPAPVKIDMAALILRYTAAAETAKDTDELDLAWNTIITPAEDTMPIEIYEQACVIDDRVRGKLE